MITIPSNAFDFPGQCQECGRETFRKSLVCPWCAKKVKKEGGRGESKNTVQKEYFFRDAFRVSLRLASGEYKRFPFWYVSMNCGCSTSSDLSGKEIPGEVLEFLTTIKLRGHESGYRAFLCDKEKDFVYDLRRALINLKAETRKDQIYLLPRNNRGILPEIVSPIIRERIRKYGGSAPGCIVVDPNGPSPLHTPWEEIIEFCNEFKVMDLITNVNFGTINRSKGVNKIKGFTRKWLFRSVDELFSLFPKRHWMIARPLWGKNSFITAIARNSKVDRIPHYVFVPLEGKRGQTIMKEVRDYESGVKLPE